MAGTVGQKFAIKDVVDVTLTPLGEAEAEGQAITINYLNSCQLTLESESVYATEKGNNSISFGGSRTGTFTMSAQVIKDEFLAMMLGGTYNKSDGSITVTGAIPTKSYKLSGTFNVALADGTQVLRKIELAKVTPQPSTDMTLSATDIAEFQLVMDVLVDNDQLLKIVDNEG